jgi:hypothetical protein
VLVLRYTVPADQVAGQVAGHVSYLERGHVIGRSLLSGQTVPGDLGGVILAVGERDEIERLAAEEPFTAPRQNRYRSSWASWPGAWTEIRFKEAAPST